MSQRFEPTGSIPRYALRLGQDKLYRTYRRHPIVFLRGLLWPLLLLVPLALLALAFADSGIIAGLLFFLVAVLGLWIGYIWLDWRSDYMAVTDHRVVVNMERPGIQRELREIPLGKVQNIITQQGGVFQHLIGDATLILDTSGLGRITFADIFEKDAREARDLILWLQKSAQASALPNKEAYREASVRSMIYGTPPPPRPRRIETISWPRSGYGTFNSLFPVAPQRDDKTVIWHKHWWFLLKAERGPLLLLFGYEFTNVLIAVIAALLQVDSSDLIGLLGLARIPLYLIAIPWLLWQWQDWRNDEYVLTGDRLIDKETLPFSLREEVKETELRRVTDATVTVNGILPNLLRFGDVVIKTPGEATQFTFDGVPHPFEVQREIMQRLDAQRDAEQAQWDGDIEKWLRTYIDERRAEPAPQAPPPRDDWNLGW